MSELFFMSGVINSISEGGLFRRAFAIVLRIIAVLQLVLGLVAWIITWGAIFRMPVLGIIGGIIFQAISAVAIYMVVHTILLRANTISGLPRADFTVIPIVSILFKLIGEIYAIFLLALTIGGGILMWFAGGYAGQALYQLFRYLPFREFMPMGGGFLTGLLFMVIGVIIAFLMLVLFYFLSESLVVLVDIAKNIRFTRSVAEQYDKSGPEPAEDIEPV